MATAPITCELLDGYFNCKYLAHLRLTGHQGTISDYEQMRHETALEHRLAATEKLIARYHGKGIQTDVVLTQALLREGAAFILNAKLEDDVFSLRLHGLKKVEGRSDLGEFHYIPMLFSGSRKVHKNEKLYLETVGAVLGRLQGRAPVRGVVCHGPSYTTTSVRFTGGLRGAEDALRELFRMQSGSVQPKLLLNDHCQVCEFRTQCRDQALKEDNLTLLRGLGQQELKRLRAGDCSLSLSFHIRFDRGDAENGIAPHVRVITLCKPSQYEIRRFMSSGLPRCPQAPRTSTWTSREIRAGNSFI